MRTRGRRRRARVGLSTLVECKINAEPASGLQPKEREVSFPAVFYSCAASSRSAKFNIKMNSPNLEERLVPEMREGGTTQCVGRAPVSAALSRPASEPTSIGVSAEERGRGKYAIVDSWRALLGPPTRQREPLGREFSRRAARFPLAARIKFNPPAGAQLGSFSRSLIVALTSQVCSQMIDHCQASGRTALARGRIPRRD